MIILITLLSIAIAAQFTNIRIKDKQLENLNIEYRELKDANKVASDEIAKHFRQKVELKRDKSILNNKITNLNRKLESAENKLEQRELFYTKEIEALNHDVQDKQNKFNLLRLDYADYISELETALKQVDRERYCITFNDLGYPSPYPAMSGQVVDRVVR